MTGDDGQVAAEPVVFTVTVVDLATVQRLLLVVAGRRHAITRFAAERSASGGWCVTLDCPVLGEDARLLQERLARPACVLTVTASRRTATN